jgi:hypothetical protein
MQSVVRTFGEFSRFSLTNLFPKKMHPSLYIFAINDGYFELVLKKLIVTPVMKLSELAHAIVHVTVPQWLQRQKRISKEELSQSIFNSFVPMLLILCAGVILDVLLRSYAVVRLFSLCVALVLALASLGENRQGFRALLLAIFGNLFAFLSVTSSKAGFLYLIGLVTSAIIAIEALIYMYKRRDMRDLKLGLGLYQQFPLMGTLLLLGSLGIVSFPISSTFFGEDLLLNLSASSGLHFIFIFQIIFIISGIAVIRLYSWVMLGRRDNAMKAIDLDISAFSLFMRLAFFVGGNMLAFVLALS